jgi:hypothetical protein
MFRSTGGDNGEAVVDDGMATNMSCHSRLRSRSRNILQVQRRPMNRDMLHYLGKADPLFCLL